MNEPSPSLFSQIEVLELGESHVRLERVPIGEASDEAIKDTMARARNSSNQITNRLRKRGRGDYRVESATMLAPDRSSILCMAITTRTEEDEIDI